MKFDTETLSNLLEMMKLQDKGSITMEELVQMQNNTSTVKIHNNEQEKVASPKAFHSPEISFTPKSSNKKSMRTSKPTSNKTSPNDSTKGANTASSVEKKKKSLSSGDFKFSSPDKLPFTPKKVVSKKIPQQETSKAAPNEERSSKGTGMAGAGSKSARGRFLSPNATSSKSSGWSWASAGEPNPLAFNPSIKSFNSGLQTQQKNPMTPFSIGASKRQDSKKRGKKKAVGVSVGVGLDMESDKATPMQTSTSPPSAVFSSNSISGPATDSVDTKSTVHSIDGMGSSHTCSQTFSGGNENISPNTSNSGSGSNTETQAEVCCIQQGRDFFGRGLYAEALESFSTGVKGLFGKQSNEEKSVMLSNRSATLVILHRYTLAIADCEEALKIAPSLVHLQVRRAQCLIKLGDFRAALDAFSLVLASKDDPFSATGGSGHNTPLWNSIIWLDNEHAHDVGANGTYMESKDGINDSLRGLHGMPQHRLVALSKQEAAFGLQQTATLQDMMSALAQAEEQLNYNQTLRIAQQILEKAPMCATAIESMAKSLCGLMRYEECKGFIEALPQDTSTSTFPTVASLQWREIVVTNTVHMVPVMVVTALQCMGPSLARIYLNCLKNMKLNRTCSTDVMKKLLGVVKDLHNSLQGNDLAGHWKWVTDTAEDMESIVTAKDSADSSFQKKNYREAIINYTAALKVDPTAVLWCAILFCSKAAAGIEMGMYKEALRDCQNALGKDPSYSRAYIQRARAYKGLDKISDSIRDYQHYLSESSLDREVRQELDNIVSANSQALKDAHNKHQTQTQEQHRQQGLESQQNQQQNRTTSKAFEAAKDDATSKEHTDTKVPPLAGLFGAAGSSTSNKLYRQREKKNVGGNEHSGEPKLSINDNDRYKCRTSSSGNSGSNNSGYSARSASSSDFRHVPPPPPLTPKKPLANRGPQASEGARAGNACTNSNTNSNNENNTSNTNNTNKSNITSNINNSKSSSTINSSGSRSSSNKPTPNSIPKFPYFSPRKKTGCHYTTLDLTSDASDRDIKVAYRKFARLFHPDKNKDPQAAEHFKAISLSYQTLSDKAARRQYDLTRPLSTRSFRR